MDAREEILSALRDSHAGLDTNALARRLGLHPNTVRWHLGVLGRRGLVSSRPERGQRRGRPSVVHRLTPEGVVHGRDEYRLLAAMLTAVVAGGDRVASGVYETGMRWGRYLLGMPHPSASTDDPDVLARVSELLDDHGFAAELEGTRICMRRCPFSDLAETSPEIICTLHHGIIDGALAETGSRLRVAKLANFVEPTLCIADLEARSD
jgi:predicted ArsR family transcriptional regulator